MLVSKIDLSPWLSNAKHHSRVSRESREAALVLAFPHRSPSLPEVKRPKRRKKKKEKKSWSVQRGAWIPKSHLIFAHLLSFFSSLFFVDCDEFFSSSGFCEGDNDYSVTHILHERDGKVHGFDVSFQLPPHHGSYSIAPLFFLFRSPQSLICRHASLAQSFAHLPI